jgi:hypothetical protein
MACDGCGQTKVYVVRSLDGRERICLTRGEAVIIAKALPGAVIIERTKR